MIAVENIRMGDICKVDKNGRISRMTNVDEIIAVQNECPHAKIEVSALGKPSNAYSPTYRCTDCHKLFSATYAFTLLWNHFMPLHPKVVGVSDLARGASTATDTATAMREMMGWHDPNNPATLYGEEIKRNKT